MSQVGITHFLSSLATYSISFTIQFFFPPLLYYISRIKWWNHLLSSSAPSKYMDRMFQLQIGIFQMWNRSFYAVMHVVACSKFNFASRLVLVCCLQGSLDVRLFSHPHSISLLALFVLRAYVASSRNRKAPSLPLIASAPLNLEAGTCILVGVPPTCEDSPRK